MGEQLVDGLAAQGHESQLLVVGFPDPGGVVLRAEVQEQQGARSVYGLHELREKGFASRIDPVQVVDQNHARLGLAAVFHQTTHELEKLPLPRLGLHQRRWPLRIGHAEEIEQHGQRLSEAPVEQEQPSGDLLARHRVGVLLADPEVSAQQLPGGEQRSGLPMGRAVSLVDLQALRTDVLNKLEAEPALPHAGLAHDADDLAVTARGPLERGLQPSHLIRTADETEEASRARQVEPRAYGTGALELVHAQRLRHALDVRLPEIAQLEEPFDQAGGVLGEADAVRSGDLLHARSQTDGRTLGGVVHAQVVPDLAHHDLARVEPDAHAKIDPALQAQLVRVAAQLLGEVQRRVTRTLRVVFMGDGRPEEGHDPIARELVDCALEAMHTLGQNREKAVHDAVPLLGINGAGELHRTMDICEEHRDQLALAFECRLARQDLVGEVRGRVDARIALGSLARCQGCATLHAEVGLRRVLMLTG